jgi:RNA-directed DNA polymerase
MMHGSGKSDEAIVAGKPANKAERSVAESVERRAEAKGNAGQYGMDRTQRRTDMSQALDRIRQAARRFAVTYPRWEPYAGKPLVRFCAGGAQQ